MVGGMPTAPPPSAPPEASLEEVFKALADPTRLAVVERLGIGPASTSELAQPFTMALPSFAQHLDVLERTGLVTSTKQGRTRIYRLTPAPLEHAGSWLAAQREHWTRRLDQLDRHLLTMTANPVNTGNTTNTNTNTREPT
jgi:DNA-binding transcriptional ArsR family regulator